MVERHQVIEFIESLTATERAQLFADAGMPHNTDVYEAMLHDLATSDGLWCTDKPIEGGFQLTHKSLEAARALNGLGDN